MTDKPVISNTSPLIGLSGINLLSLYRDIYTEVWIPKEVENEFLAIQDLRKMTKFHLFSHDSVRLETAPTG